METLCKDLGVESYPSLFSVSKRLRYKHIDRIKSFKKLSEMFENPEQDDSAENGFLDLYEELERARKKRVWYFVNTKHLKRMMNFWSHSFNGASFLLVLNAGFIFAGWLLSKRFAEFVFPSKTQ